MSMRYATSGSIVNLTSDRDEIVTDELPAKTYTINFNQMSGQFFLKITEDMKLPQKIFGDTEIVARRIINTFLSRPEQTGVHLTGEKGSGKTLLMKIISKILRDEYDIPTVLVNNSFQGEAFNSFISSIETRTLVIFDEFEKIYGYDDQQQLLTLFDGTRNSKKLFMVSSNDYSSVSSQMSNRPGRFYYKLSYSGLEEEFVREYVNNVLENKDHMQSVINLSKIIGSSFNFDMLKAVVEEMNRYQETADQAIKYLNVSPITSTDDFEIREFKSTIADEVECTTLRMNPYKNFVLDCWNSAKKDEDGDNEYVSIGFTPDDIKKTDGDSFVFQNATTQVMFVRKKEKNFDFFKFI